MATTKAYPPGGTFLDTLKKSFADVPVDKEHDNAVATTEFLEAAESLTTLFGTSLPFLCFIYILVYRAGLTNILDVLGSMAFNPVKSDMLGNVKVPRHSTCFEHILYKQGGS